MALENSCSSLTKTLCLFHEGSTGVFDLHEQRTSYKQIRTSGIDNRKCCTLPASTIDGVN